MSLNMKGHYDRAILDHINWALDLGQRNVNELRDGDVLNLYEEGRGFMGEDQSDRFVQALKRAVPVKDKRTRTFKQKRDYVVSLAKGFNLAVGWLREGATFKWMAGDDEGYSILFTREPFRLTVEPVAIDHRAIIRLDYFIQSQGFPAEQIRPCSECGHVFAVAMRLRKDLKNYYHSERCRQTAVARNRVR